MSWLTNLAEFHVQVLTALVTRILTVLMDNCHKHGQ